MSKIHVVLIDPIEKKITNLEIENNLDAYYKAMNCSLIDHVYVPSLGKNHGIYVDDEGLLKSSENIHLFSISGYPAPLAGKALVVAHTESGKTISCNVFANDIKKIVRFLS